MTVRLIDVMSSGASRQIQLALDEVALSLSPELISTDGLKQVLLEDPFVEVEVLSRGRFKVVSNNGVLFKQAVLRDFYCGCMRVKAQHQTLKSLAKERIAPPWDLTTAYYCAFFSAIELLRLQGTYQISFDVEGHGSLLNRARGDMSLLKDAKSYTGKLSGCGEEIIFTSTAARPHQAVWQNIYSFVTSPLSDKYPDWKELHTLNLILSGQQKWSRPSDVRNDWNYARSEFYSEISQPFVSEFYSLVDNGRSACKWLERSMSVHPCMKAHATSVAVVCEVLSSSVIAAYAKLTSGSKGVESRPAKKASRSERRRNKGRMRKRV